MSTRPNHPCEQICFPRPDKAGEAPRDPARPRRAARDVPGGRRPPTVRGRQCAGFMLASGASWVPLDALRAERASLLVEARDAHDQPLVRMAVGDARPALPPDRDHDAKHATAVKASG
jgi:hypothetical protein